MLSSVTNSNVAYQWKRNNIDIPNTNIDAYEAKTDGRYKVIVTDNEGCTNFSNMIEVTGQNCRNGYFENSNSNKIMAALWQNNLHISCTDVYENAHFLLHNTDGSLIMRNKISFSSTTINLDNMANGMYLLNVTNGVTTSVFKLVVLNGENTIHTPR